MTFRTTESRNELLAKAINCLVLNKDYKLTNDEKSRALSFLNDLVKDIGSVISTYSTWHPLYAFTLGLGKQNGFDHVIRFAHGFITVPYSEEAANLLADKANNEKSDLGRFSADKLWLQDIKLYNNKAFPLLVRFDWNKPLNSDHTVPTGVAIRAMLMTELPKQDYSQCSESWDRMADDFLGTPRGKVSSLLVNQKTGNAMKAVWNAIYKAEVFGKARNSLDAFFSTDREKTSK